MLGVSDLSQLVEGDHTVGQVFGDIDLLQRVVVGQCVVLGLIDPTVVEEGSKASTFPEAVTSRMGTRFPDLLGGQLTVGPSLIESVAVEPVVVGETGSFCFSLGENPILEG